MVENTNGTADVFDGITIAGPSLSVHPDYTRLALYGITSTILQYQVQTALEGNLVGNIFDKDRVYPVRLVYHGNTQMSVDDLKNLKIALPDGRLKSISELATVEVNGGDAQIERENLQSMGVVSARFENRNLGSTMKDIKSKVSKQVNLPRGLQYRIR